MYWERKLGFTKVRPPVSWLHAFVAVVGGLGLAWLVISTSLVAYLADFGPELALRIDPQQPRALLNLAERRLAELEADDDGPRSHVDGRGTADDQVGRFAPRALKLGTAARLGDGQADPAARAFAEAEAVAEIRDLATLALKAAPADPRPYRILGALSERSGDRDETRKFYQAAARRSLHESSAIYWLMKDSFERNAYEATLKYADILLRTRSNAMSEVLPFLARLAEMPESADLVKALVVANPPWRSHFFASLPLQVTDARTPLTLLLAAKTGANAVTPADLRGYLNFLIAKNFHKLAYYTWLQFLPPEQLATAGLLFNGDFEHSPSGLPFDWHIVAGAGTRAEIQPLPDKGQERGLRIEFTNGRVQFPGVSQTLLLIPGTYSLSGRHMGELIGRRGLRWRIECSAPSAYQLAETPMFLGKVGDWQQFTLEFTVPQNGCQAQIVRLMLDARSASERLVTGTAWFDTLRIELQP